MNHQDFTARRGRVATSDADPACPGEFTFICHADFGDADWDMYRCAACGQHFVTADTPGATWNRIVTSAWVIEIVNSGRAWQ